MPSATTWIGSAAVLGALSYLVYFDYQRRSSPEFRRQIRRRANEFARKEEAAVKETRSKQRNEIETLIETSLAESPLPTNIQDREQFFIAEVARADDLAKLGPAGYLEAALAFYRALMIYPAPADLLGVYEKSVNAPEVLDYLRTMVVLRPPPALAAAVQESASPDLAVE